MKNTLTSKGASTKKPDAGASSLVAPKAVEATSAKDVVESNSQFSPAQRTQIEARTTSLIEEFLPKGGSALSRFDLAGELRRLSTSMLLEAEDGLAKPAVQEILQRLHETDPTIVGVRFIRDLWEQDGGEVIIIAHVQLGFRDDPSAGIEWFDDDDCGLPESYEKESGETLEGIGQHILQSEDHVESVTVLLPTGKKKS